MPLALAPLVLVVMNIVYALCAYPLGAFSDRIDRKRMLAMGFATLISLISCFAPNLLVVMIGALVTRLLPRRRAAEEGRYPSGQNQPDKFA